MTSKLVEEIGIKKNLATQSCFRCDLAKTLFLSPIVTHEPAATGQIHSHHQFLYSFLTEALCGIS
jgi:hypothetical protein